MADITKCDNESCELKNECYRFTAVESEYRQSYFAETPQPINGECSHFWNNEGYTK